MTDGNTKTIPSRAAPCHPVQLDPALYPRTLKQTPTFGVDHVGRYTVFDSDGFEYFGPIALGEFPEGFLWVDRKFLRVNHFAEAKCEELEQLWSHDLMMMAWYFFKQRLTAHLQDIDMNGPSLAPLVRRSSKKDEHIVKALDSWGRRVELIEDVPSFSVILPKGTPSSLTMAWRSRPNKSQFPAAWGHLRQLGQRHFNCPFSGPPVQYIVFKVQLGGP